MPRSTLRRVGASTFIAAVSVAAAVPGPAQAAATFDVLLPAGTGCAFELGLDITPNANRVFKEFTDANGNVVRTILAGKGSTLTFTNTATGATFTLKSNGSVSTETFNPDGSSTVVDTGHNVVILFPTDVPAGPTTTLYTGRLVYNSTATDDFTIVRVSGKTRDICAELE